MRREPTCGRLPATRRNTGEHTMSDVREKILSESAKDEDYIIALRRDFHAHPELSTKEYRTAETIEKELDKLGLAHKRVGGTGVYAEINGTAQGENRTIVLRADTDALPVTEEHDCPYKSKNPGVMHACGHDAHTASLIGAARFLARNRDLFSGTVRLTFQPGEEIGYGARIFVDEGYLDGAQRSVGIHLASRIDVGKVSIVPGPNNASVDWFRINVAGKGAHISTPQRGVDAAYIASSIVVGLQALVTKTTSPIDSVLIGVGKITAGTAYNVIASSAEIEGTVRVYDVDIRREMKKRITSLAQATAQAYGGSASIEWKDFTSPLINDPAVSNELQKSVGALIGEENILTTGEPSLGGDDFAEYILKVPGAYMYVGSGNKDIPETTLSHHDSHFDIDERCLLVGTRAYIAAVLDYLK